MDADVLKEAMRAKKETVKYPEAVRIALTQACRTHIGATRT